MKKIISEPKKIFLLGDSGVGKSTLINCLEEKKLAIEATKKVPTTMKYEEFKSYKYKNIIFCDTRGTETDKFKEIEELNIKSILESIKGINSYLFWYLKGSNTNFQESDAKYIKSIQKSLNNNMPLFFVITRTNDPDDDKSSLEEIIREFFPDIKNIHIFPVIARGPKKHPEKTYGLTELMSETKKFFNTIIIQEFFNYIYQDDKKFDEQFSNLLNIPSIEKLFILILKRIRLEDYLNSNSLNNEETSLIRNFLEEKYLSFLKSNGKEIVDLCLLIKAKYDIIDVDNVEETSKRLTNFNNTVNDNEKINDNKNLQDEILQGCSKTQIEQIKKQAEKYRTNERNAKEIEKILTIFLSEMFNLELKNQVMNNLSLNGIVD